MALPNAVKRFGVDITSPKRKRVRPFPEQKLTRLRFGLVFVGIRPQKKLFTALGSAMERTDFVARHISRTGSSVGERQMGIYHPA